MLHPPAETVNHHLLGAGEFSTGEMGNFQPALTQVKISDLFDREPCKLASELARRVGALCDVGNRVLVLEHVTSEDGLLLPLVEISAELRTALPGVNLVIDGAQAAGLWRPPAGLDCTYAGCFHKYIDGPVGTGFCVLPRGLTSKALHRLRATQSENFRGTAEHLPTTDVAKWRACMEAVESLCARGSSDDRLARVLDLRRDLLEQLPSEAKLHMCHVRAEYRSHILSLNIGSNGEAKEIWRRLLERGFSTKQLDHGVRITLHHTLSSQSVGTFANVLTDLMNVGAHL
jgi:selenocysteine lyase/cysteine desulfurase